MNFGKDEASNEDVRYPRSRRWLQFYVDMFKTSCPQHCKDMRITVVPDPARSNGCNWQLSVHASEGEAEHEFPCLKSIENELKLLYTVFDLEVESEVSDGDLDLGLMRA